MIQVIQILILGIALGGVYALMSSGMTLIFGVMRIVNLAHSAFIVMAAYLAFWVFKTFNIDPILSLFITMPVMFLVGMAYYRVLFASREDNPRFTDLTVLITFATGLVIEGVLAFIFTGIYRSTTPQYAKSSFIFGPFFIPQSQLYALIISIVLIVVLWLFLRYTRIGNAVRATMQNRNAAQVVGVNVRWISTLSFGIGLAMAGAAGSLLSFIFTFYPAKHVAWIGMIMCLVVLGGMGSLVGALVSSFLLATVAAFVNFYLGASWSPITFYLSLFLILLFRPQGLFGKKVEG
ncbi:MAG: branched-chain amino acid ABC transporter permease [Chloroflexi bacterium]|nr:branched-chain amino acid ABC transporter permease [Chloroflexota bacterium]